MATMFVGAIKNIKLPLILQCNSLKLILHLLVTNNKKQYDLLDNNMFGWFTITAPSLISGITRLFYGCLQMQHKPIHLRHLLS